MHLYILRATPFAAGPQTLRASSQHLVNRR